MNNASSADISTSENMIAFAPTTGAWNANDERIPEIRYSMPLTLKMAGMLFILSFSPITAIADPWLHERQHRDAVVTMSIYEEIIGRVISRSEALQLARQILEQAERERLTAAEYEAARGIQWGEEE